MVREKITMRLISRVANKLIRTLINKKYDLGGGYSIKELGLSSEEAHEYAPTTDYFELFKLIFCLKSRDKTIVDLGCGTGSAIAVFRLFPFKKIYGVELSKYLAKKCEINFLRSKRISIINENAITFDLPVSYVYMFNPFPSEIVISCLKKLSSHNHNLIVIYRNPVFLAEIIKTFPNTYSNILFKKTFNSTYAIFRI